MIINVKDEGMGKFLFLENLASRDFVIRDLTKKKQTQTRTRERKTKGCRALKMPWVKEVRDGNVH
jgi:hypothetical protein